VFEGNTKEGAVITTPWGAECCLFVLARSQIVVIFGNDILLSVPWFADVQAPVLVMEEE
jgi:hypothetical protein